MIFIRPRFIIGRKSLPLQVPKVLATLRLALIRNLEKENNALKQLLAEKELESKLKEEMLKKSIHI